MKFREEVSRGVSRGRKIHLKHPGRGSRLPPHQSPRSTAPTRFRRPPPQITEGRRYGEAGDIKKAAQQAAER